MKISTLFSKKARR